MSEETTQIKISMPLIDDIELQRIDTFYNDIVSEYTKAFVKEKEQVIIQRLMMNLQQENQQLKEMFEDSKTYSKEFLYKHNKNLLEANERLYRENKQLKEEKEKIKIAITENCDLRLEVLKYKEVIEEVREYVEKNLSFCENDSQGLYEKCNIRMASDRKLLQILDKVKEVNK